MAGNQGIDQWITTRDGSMYVGTVADASLLRFDWERETFSLVFVKLAEARVTSLDEDDDGMTDRRRLSAHAADPIPSRRQQCGQLRARQHQLSPLLFSCRLLLSGQSFSANPTASALPACRRFATIKASRPFPPTCRQGDVAATISIKTCDQEPRNAQKPVLIRA